MYIGYRCRSSFCACTRIIVFASFGFAEFAWVVPLVAAYGSQQFLFFIYAER